MGRNNSFNDWFHYQFNILESISVSKGIKYLDQGQASRTAQGYHNINMVIHSSSNIFKVRNYKTSGSCWYAEFQFLFWPEIMFPDQRIINNI